MGGSSAGVMAAIIFICTYTPDKEIRFLFFNLKLKYIGIVFFVFDVIQIPYGNPGGHLAHIGGAMLGFFYAKNLLNGRDVRFGFERIWRSFFMRRVLDSDKKSYQQKNIKTDKSLDQEKQRKVDSVLDKINKSGYESLSNDEKNFLSSYSKD